MRRGSIQATLVACCALCLLVAPAAGAPVAETGGLDASEHASTTPDGSVCDAVNESGTVAVATMAGTDEPVVDDRALYAGTELTVQLCDAEGVVTPYGTDGAWSLADGDGYEILRTTNSNVTIRLTAEYGRLAVADQVRPTEKTDTGPVLTEPSANTVRPFDADARLYLTSADAVDSYRERESAFRTATNETAAATDRLETVTAAVESGRLTDARASNATETLRTLANATNATATAGDAYRTYLFGVATRSPTPGVAVDAIETSRERENGTRSAAATAVDEYESALDARANTLQSRIRSNVLLGLVGGLVLGLVLGGVVPWLAASSTVGRIRVDSSTEYSRKAQWLPAGVGVLVLLVTVGALAATGGLSILGVIL